MPDGEEAQVRANQRNQPVAGINVLRWELGQELRALRQTAGKSIADAAKYLECSDAKISRMENGQRGAVARDVRDLCKLYGVPAQRRDELMKLSREAVEADKATSTTIQAKHSTFIALESQALNLRNYEMTFVPGLLQTESYARETITRNGDSRESAEVEELVRIRMDRQKRIWNEGSLKAHFIIDENVLRRVAAMAPAPGAVREEQIDRLIKATYLKNVTLQIIPFGAGFYQGMEGATIHLLNLDEGPNASSACYVEGVFRELFVRGRTEIAAIDAKFAAMAKAAHDEKTSRKFLMRLLRRNYEDWSSGRPQGPSD